MKLISNFLLMCILASPTLVFAEAGGHSGAGGGDGYRADFVKVAHAVYEWLNKNPSFDVKVKADDFLLVIDPNKVESTPTQLYYKGLPVDALYDYGTQVITIYRTGWDSEGTPQRWSLVAHELFRKLGIEGDDYAISSKLIIQAFSKPDISMLKSGDYSALGDTTLSQSSSGACYRHIEVDPSNASITVQFREKITGACGDSILIPINNGYVETFQCYTSDAMPDHWLDLFKDGSTTYCIQAGEFQFSQRIPSRNRKEILKPLSDGNFTVKTIRIVNAPSVKFLDFSDSCDQSGRVSYSNVLPPTAIGCEPSNRYDESKFLPKVL